MVSGYDKEAGLYIANYNPESQETLDAGGYQKAGAKYTASIPSYPVFINGKQIDSSKEEYPLLNFRNVTYFPLTWRFVAGEFGWDQTWSAASGYKLSTYGSATEYSPGTHYVDVNFYPLESYRDYAVAEKMSEERSSHRHEADQYGSYVNSYVGRTFTYYRLDYATDTLTEIPVGTNLRHTVSFRRCQR